MSVHLCVFMPPETGDTGTRVFLSRVPTLGEYVQLGPSFYPVIRVHHKNSRREHAVDADIWLDVAGRQPV